MFDITTAQPLAVFCPNGGCGCGQDPCPELYIDESAPVDQRVVIADDFGAQIRMSAAQFGDIVAQSKSGALDTII
ncbi:MAG: hypothetical protein ACRDRZ_13590 [Pseudonocardiaceae bacterium]